METQLSSIFVVLSLFIYLCVFCAKTINWAEYIGTNCHLKALHKFTLYIMQDVLHHSYTSKEWLEKFI